MDRSCTIHSDFSYDSSFCNSLGSAQTSGESAYSRYTRFLSFDTITSTSSNSKYGVFIDSVTSRASVTPTEFDRCLPGPTSGCSQGGDFGWLGPHCPQGYFAITATTVTGDLSSETLRMITEHCCPSNPLFTPNVLGRNWELSLESVAYYVSPETVPFTTTYCGYYWVDRPGQTVLPIGTASSPDSISLTAYTLSVRPFMVVRTDTSSTSPGSNSGLASSTPSPAPLSPGPLPPPTSTASSSMPTSTKIGIGAGAGIGGLFLLTAIATIVLLLLRRRRTDGRESPSGKAELHSEGLPRSQSPAEIDDGPMQELADTGVPVEIGEGLSENEEGLREDRE
ncbi:hypothetical protein BDV95DRAFT_619756 [Massariosphaeria phaeospora]|uniref:Uncharacterized protein n=1 Tax=Massariosphaeria phaeospora TaxID=100035 RepID=A0A7C8IE16_9PLEO|nr:hypothetical protein BDV95DRAFT_619756 [Massariosphaeria phaeospora]